MKIKKHDGRLDPFDPLKIVRAVQAAGASRETAQSVADKISAKIIDAETVASDVCELSCSVDAVHNTVETELMKLDPVAAKKYILFRQQRTDYREYESPINQAIEKYYSEINRDNANAANGSAASKMYSIAEAATKSYNLSRMNKTAAYNHRKGRVYIHDLAYRNITFNCFFNPIGKMLKDGFDNGVGYIRPPRRIGSATALVSIIMQSSQNSLFGGQGILNFDTDLAPFVQREYEYQCNLLENTIRDTGAMTFNLGKDKRKAIAMQRTEAAVYQAMEAFVYNCNTMRSRSGEVCAA